MTKAKYKTLYQSAFLWQNYFFALKYLVVGGNDCKKWLLIRHYLDENFSTFKSTIQKDFLPKRLSYNTDLNFYVLFWIIDEYMSNSHYKNTHCAIVMINMHNENSLEDAQKWLNSIKNYSNNTDITSVIVSTYENNATVLTESEIIKFAIHQKVDYFFVNIDSVDEVNKTFASIHQLVVKNLQLSINSISHTNINGKNKTTINCCSVN